MNRYICTVNGQQFDIEITEIGSRTVASAAPAAQAAPAPSATAAPAPAAAAGSVNVESPMPGTILDVKVAAGDKVSRGQVLMILEAMKMENEIVAPADGQVAAVLVQKGSAVNSGDVLAKLA